MSDKVKPWHQRKPKHHGGNHKKVSPLRAGGDKRISPLRVSDQDIDPDLIPGDDDWLDDGWQGPES